MNEVHAQIAEGKTRFRFPFGLKIMIYVFKVLRLCMSLALLMIYQKEYILTFLS